MSGFFFNFPLCIIVSLYLFKKIKKEEKKEKNKSTSGSKFLFQELNKEETLIDMYNHKR